MFAQLYGSIFALLVQAALYGNVVAGGTPGQFVLETSTLPTDLNFMPSLSNGHLGFTVFGDSVYMNGVYNGYKGESRRARLPNWLNIKGSIAPAQAFAFGPSEPDLYSMNLLQSHFQWTTNFPEYGMTLKQRVYAHRFYNRALIYEFFAVRNTSGVSITFELENYPGAESTAFDVKKVANNDGITLLRCTTKKGENEHFQTQPTQIYVALSDFFEDGRKLIHYKRDQKLLYYRYVFTADVDKRVALKEMEEVLSKKESELLDENILHWREFWDSFYIDIESNLELAQITNAGIYYIANSLPSKRSYHKNNPYFGLSPTGLGRGRLNDDYQGHNFWDTEIWMLPAVTQLSTSWSKDLFKYRLDHLDGARYNANQTGFRGARYPWESAFTGTEVTNPCCPEVATQEIHISADIVVALRQFYGTTHDREWLCSSAWPLARDIASFLSSRTTRNNQTNQYHIRNVMGPDEDHENVDDNVYTNVACKQALQFACFSHSLCLPESRQPTEEGWEDIANNMFVLYDAVRDYHPQDKDYQPGEEVKQADTILLGYPLQFDIANSTRYNDLFMYENVTRSSGPAMTWSMFAINFLDIAIKDKADAYFTRGYKEYVRPEFKVWSETKIGHRGSANFLTGVGGYLQSIINGYAGLRFYLHNDKSQMAICNPQPLPGTSGFLLKGIKFANSVFSLKVTVSGVHTLTCLQCGNTSLELHRGNMRPRSIFAGFAIQFKTESIFVQTT